MHNGNLARVDDGFAVKAHQMNGLDILAEALHVIKVRVHGVKALHTGSTGGDDHVLACAHQFNAGARDVGLQILGVVAAGKCDAEQTLRCFADFQRLHNTAGGLQRGDNQCASLRDVEFFLRCRDGIGHQKHILGALGLGDADGIAAARDCRTDVLAPVRAVQTVDADDALNIAVIDLLQGVVEGEARSILFLLGHGILQVQHDGVGLIDVGVFDKTRLLAV